MTFAAIVMVTVIQSSTHTYIYIYPLYNKNLTSACSGKIRLRQADVQCDPDAIDLALKGPM